MVEYKLSSAGPVRLSIFDLLGRKLIVRIDDVKSAGMHKTWLETGRLSSGTYFLALQVEGGRTTRPMTVIR